MSSPESLSYSILLNRLQTAQVPPPPVDTVRQRVGISWVPDDTVNRCYECNSTFGLFCRRHHCRGCGRIFCDSCSRYRIVLPKNLEAYPVNPKSGAAWNNWLQVSSWTKTPTSEAKERVCKKCYERFILIYSAKDIIHVFSYLTIKDVMRLLPTCKKWFQAGNVYRSIFRELQYIAPGYALSPIQQRILRNNMPFIAGHSRYLLRPFCNLPDLTLDELMQLMNEKKKIKCRSMMCTRVCTEKINGFDVLEFLDVRTPYIKFREYIVSRLNTLSDIELECVLPTVVYGLRNEISKDTTLIDFLVERSRTSITIRTQTFWLLVMFKSRDTFYHGFYGVFLAKINEHFKKEVVFDQLLKGRKFFKHLAEIPNNEAKVRDAVQRIELDGSIPLPIDPTVRVKRILHEHIHVKDSMTAPVLVPLECTSENQPSFQKDLLIKREDLIVDAVVMHIISLMDLILKKEEQTDFHILTYKVLPANKDCGFIEIIQQASTLYSIQNRHKMSIQNYLLEKNKHLPISEIRDRFIKSAAAYCVISYLLGVGDRHLENIMLSDQGFLFHIDYGFVLGFDTKILAPSIRITTGIVDCLGGEASSDFKQFKMTCSRIYNCLRRHSNLILTLLNLLSEDCLNISKGKYKKDLIREEILKRCAPAERDEDAEKNLIFKIETSMNSTTQHIFIDMAHYYAKEVFTSRNLHFPKIL